MANKIHYILTDIEGTTTAIDFVHKILFPYAAKHLASFLQQPQPQDIQTTIEAALTQVKETILAETTDTETSLERCLKHLERWIETDRKHPALKTIQGMIWRIGYENGDFKGHIYDDVLPALTHWREQGIQLGIYSSGSVAAQKLLFGNLPEGNITPLFAHNFDTKVGHKQDVTSYQNIAKQLTINPENILFLSDVEAELHAANQALMQTIQLVRENTIPSKQFRTVADFSEITF